MLQQRQRESVNRQQRLILALGCGSSVAIHLGLMAAISYWWRSPAPVDEQIEITLIEPSEIEPVTVATSPPLAKPPKISITHSPDRLDRPKPTVLKSVSKPIVVTPAPKSVAVVVKPISKPIRTVAQPKPRSSSIQTKVKPNPRPIQTARVNLPVNPKPVPNPFPIEPKTPTPNPVRSSIIDPPIVSKLKSTPIQSQPQTIPSGLTGNGSRSGVPQVGSLQPPNSSTSGSGNGNALSAVLSRFHGRGTRPERAAEADATRTEGLRPGVGSSAPGGDSSFSTSQTGGSGSGGGGGLQCIQNCDIPKLRDLQDWDGGKDRLRIRIIVDPNGLVLAATISKSSDNPQIDAIVLEGIKQMQFKPPEKIIKGIIKANIIL